MSPVHATASPRGERIAFVRDTSLGIQSVRTGRTQLFKIGPPFNLVKAKYIRWSADDRRFLICSDNGVKIHILSEQLETIADIDNGNGGLGSILSTEFVGNDHVLVIWEFGHAKIWSLKSGKHLEMPDAKLSRDGQTRQLRPSLNENQVTPLLAMLSRTGSDDYLVFYHASSPQIQPPIKIPTVDARSISWSPDGRWIAILDLPSTNANLHIYTSDGHLFRTYKSTHGDALEAGLGIKKVVWSPNGQILVLARYDSSVQLLNTRTFALIATLRHTTTIDHRSSPEEVRAIAWQESVSASGTRAYTEAPHPVAPLLSDKKPTAEPDELGVTNIAFSCDGSFLATCDSRMLNTAWIWDARSFTLKAALLLHRDVRKLIWHPTSPEKLMIDTAESIARTFTVEARQQPSYISTECRPKAALSWVWTPHGSKGTILAADSSQFKLLYPEGRDESQEQNHSEVPDADSSFQQDDVLEDSLFDMLSGRKPMPPKTEPSYTERVDMEAEAADDSFQGDLDDTFHGKQPPKMNEPDPFDDSEIF